MVDGEEVSQVLCFPWWANGGTIGVLLSIDMVQSTTNCSTYEQFVNLSHVIVCMYGMVWPSDANSRLC